MMKKGLILLLCLALLLGFIAVISVKDIFQLVTGTFPTI